MAAQLIVTNAPEAYDWGWAHTKAQKYGMFGDKPCRLVEVTDEFHARMQMGRYQSGLYVAMTQAQFLDECQKYPEYQRLTI